MFDRDHDARVRAAAFDWLARQVDLHGEVLPRDVLAAGFTFESERWAHPYHWGVSVLYGERR